jgi:hypothetical protein
MGSTQVILVLAGALAAGIVNGMTGFGTAVTAVGIWVYVIPPEAAASLAIICAAVAQLQTLPMMWRSIRWDRVVPMVVPGVVGVPLGTLLLTHIDPKAFKLLIGCFLIIYPIYALFRKDRFHSDWGGRAADGVVGFGGGILGGLTGLAGPLPVIWTDVRGWAKEHRRAVVQAFNFTVLSFAAVSHAVSGLLTRDVLIDTAIALPATIGGAWFGAFLYRRLADQTYLRAVMILLFVSGAALIWASW